MTYLVQARETEGRLSEFWTNFGRYKTLEQAWEVIRQQRRFFPNNEYRIKP